LRRGGGDHRTRKSLCGRLEHILVTHGSSKKGGRQVKGVGWEGVQDELWRGGTGEVLFLAASWAGLVQFMVGEGSWGHFDFGGEVIWLMRRDWMRRLYYKRLVLGKKSVLPWSGNGHSHNAQNQKERKEGRSISR